MLTLVQVLKFLIVFLYGCVIGSFANMLIDRFVERIEAEEKGIKLERSRKNLYFNHFTFDCECVRKGMALVPVLGYFFLKGKCPNCGKKINKRYFIIELLMGILFGANVLVNGFNVISFLNCLVIAALVILSVVDFKTFEIPIQTNYFILFIGIIVSIYDYGNILEHIIGFFCVSSGLWILIYLSGGRAMGGGDLKLMATCGLLLGWKVIIVSFVIGCILGSVIHIIRMKIEKKESMLALGPYLSMGVFVGMLYGPAMIEFYLKLWR